MSKSDHENNVPRNIWARYRAALQMPQECLTKEDIRLRLGLLSHEEIIKESLNKGYYPRRSGRTTEMLLSALENLAAGERIVLVAHEYGYASSLKVALLYMAEALGININENYINVKASSSWRKLRYETAGRSKATVFIDNYEFMGY